MNVPTVWKSILGFTLWYAAWSLPAISEPSLTLDGNVVIFSKDSPVSLCHLVLRFLRPVTVIPLLLLLFLLQFFQAHPAVTNNLTSADLSTSFIPNTLTSYWSAAAVKTMKLRKLMCVCVAFFSHFPTYLWPKIFVSPTWWLPQLKHKMNAMQ